MKNLTNAEWTALRASWGLRPSRISHFWGTMPPEFKEGGDLPFLVEGDLVGFSIRHKRAFGEYHPAVEFDFCPAEGGDE